MQPASTYHPATKNTIFVYHLESEAVRVLIKDGDLDVYSEFEVNKDPEGHAMYHMHPDEFNAHTQESLDAHLKHHIPIHKAWVKATNHRYRKDQRKAAEEFRKHLNALSVT